MRWIDVVFMIGPTVGADPAAFSVCGLGRAISAKMRAVTKQKPKPPTSDEALREAIEQCVAQDRPDLLLKLIDEMRRLIAEASPLNMRPKS